MTKISVNNNGNAATGGSGALGNASKQVIYVDVDDEITAIVDKVNASSAKVVALVLPKRATVFQSVVNMKLLKRRAESAKKHVVLITSEPGLMPLAGLAGIHVAATPQSKPEIPETSALEDDLDDEEATLGSDDFDRDSNAAAPIGGLADKGPKPVNSLYDEDISDLDAASNGLAGVAGSSAAAGKMAAAKKPAGPKNKKLNVPNFFRFRKRFILAGLLIILLVVGWYFAYFVMPQASVTIKTNSSDVDADLALILDTKADAVDVDKLVVPAETVQEQKSSTGQAPASGQANKGDKAKGTVTITNCTPTSDPVTIPAGTGVSSGDKTFITQKSVTLENSTPNCKSVEGFTSASVDVVAQNPGAGYNVAAGAFTVAGVSNVKAASSNPMSGGTDNNVKVVQQSDIDAAQQKLSSGSDQDAVKKQLEQRLEDDNMYALPATFGTGTPNQTVSSKVGDEADTITVSQTVTYTMFGVRKSDLEKIVEATVQKKVNNKNQTIQDYGLDKARFAVDTAGAGPTQKVDVNLTATAGPKIDTAALAPTLKGLKSGQVKDKIKAMPGVDDVEVKYSPFWVTKAPKAEKITIQFEKSSSSDAGTDGGTNE